MIGIVILNYRTWDLTRRCVESITDNPPDEDYKIFLVDNHSPNEPEYDLELLLDRYRIRMIRNEKNLGYNAGNNVGLRAALEAGCAAVLFTNNDIVFPSRAIQHLADGLRMHSRTGITCPRILDEMGNDCSRHMMRPLTLRDKYMVTTKLNLIFRRRYRSYYGLDRNCGKPFRIFAAQGCCVMMSADCAKVVMPFDEYPWARRSVA